LKNYQSINAFILGGGKSQRFGKDKASVEYRGKKFIDIVIECTASLFNKVYLVGRKYEHPHLDGFFFDDYQGIGPIGGIYTALRRTDRCINFFVGIDYPFIDPEIIQYLSDKMLKKASLYDGCVPVMPDGPHPLFAFYSKPCFEAAKRCISDHCYRLKCIAKYSKIWYPCISPQIKTIDFKKFQKNFININHYIEYNTLIQSKLLL